MKQGNGSIIDHFLDILVFQFSLDESFLELVSLTSIKLSVKGNALVCFIKRTHISMIYWYFTESHWNKFSLELFLRFWKIFEYPDQKNKHNKQSSAMLRYAVLLLVIKSTKCARWPYKTKASYETLHVIAVSEGVKKSFRSNTSLITNVLTHEIWELVWAKAKFPRLNEQHLRSRAGCTITKEVGKR